MSTVPCPEESPLPHKVRGSVPSGSLSPLSISFIPPWFVYTCKFLNKKYLNNGGKTSGYITGIQLANFYGFTTQNPAYYEICSNEATTKQRKLEIDGRKLIVYKPVVNITSENIGALQFLDLMCTIDNYSEIDGYEYKRKLKNFIDDVNVNFELVKQYILLYPDKVFRNIYQGGLINELV